VPQGIRECVEYVTPKPATRIEVGEQTSFDFEDSQAAKSIFFAMYKQHINFS
jgi:hypothetical protein